MHNARNVSAVLGPTNTGKTHLAVARMLDYETGMIGLPLRLLAREVYDKISSRAGAESVALITGEEKIVPPEPRFYVCTVEAMPRDLKVDFLAVDEVQLAADLDRGHIFTDRILHARGVQETMLLGSDTVRGLLSDLLPGLNIVTRPRFSKLTYAGTKKITRLPPRSAVVAFSAETVYAIAELIRRQRGGAAVVLGALSPRTRNAQVALFESGDVDFIVATDAIGMGLNMDVSHVAFAATRKFDGRMFRDLNPAELAQIAGRAGRYMEDGTFGTTGEANPPQGDVVNQIEDHRFEPVRVIQWRNRVLNFASLDELMRSLLILPKTKGLTRAMGGDDVQALEMMMREPEIRDMVTSEADVQMLWDVCQIPDYRNITSGEHARIVGQVFRSLMSSSGRVSDDWYQRQLSYADSTDGDIDTLAGRIAHVRTWTFIANRPDWLADPYRWQQQAKAIEDRLSDALHERLTQRFIDRRTSVLMKRMREKEELMASVSSDGDIHVEGEFIGQMTGFRFMPDDSATDSQAKALKAASLKAIAAEITSRAKACIGAPDSEFALKRDGAVEWKGAKIAQLEPGATILKPKTNLLANDQLEGPDRLAVQSRVETYVVDHIAAVLEPLVKLAAAEDVDGLARGLAFQLTENLGVLVRDEVAEEVKALDQSARGTLRPYGVRFGAYHVFMPMLLKPAAAELKLLLWALWQTAQPDAQSRISLDKLPEPPGQGLTSVVFDRSTPNGFYRSVGYRICGTRAVRIDMLERLADLIRPCIYWKPEKEGDERPAGSVEGGGFTVTPDMMSLVGCSGEDFSSILKGLGYRLERRPVKSEPKQEEAEPSKDESVASEEAAEPKEAAEITEAADSAEEASPAMLEIWWPGGKRQGSRQGGRQKPDQRRQKSGRPHQRNQKKPGGKFGRAANNNTKPPRKERQKEPDKDSPFAALGALKAELEKKGNG
ncbi:MAG: helicase-related protein [Pseudomonadota bacterium]